MVEREIMREGLVRSEVSERPFEASGPVSHCLQLPWPTHGHLSCGTSMDLNEYTSRFHVMAFEDLLEDPVIQKYLHELVGPKGMPVAAAPPDGEVTDEELAEELGLELNDVRRALFILYENDLASYRRLRDEDSGWLTYLWTFEYEKIPENLAEEMDRLLNALEEREGYERNHEFYLCEVCSIRFEFGEAMDFGFECPECGSPLEAMDNDFLVNAMNHRIEELRDELNVEIRAGN